MRSKRPAKVEQIPCLSRPRPPRPASGGKGKILLRMDAAAWGRATRFDLERQGYAVTSVPRLDAATIARHSPDAILFFAQAHEAPEALAQLPRGMTVIVASVGEAPAAHVEALAEARGYRMLHSRYGPCLHQVMGALSN
ncbi:MAG TPA: hypothetical protein V6D00_15535 [Pantanalinema sp.]